MSGKFFVYAAFRPWNGQPCYIGKGYGDRINVHRRAGTKHKNKHFANVFKKAAALGLQVIFVKLRAGLAEPEAHGVEIALIKAIGRFPNGPLVNKTDGGEGNVGHTHSERTKDALRERQKAANAKPEVRLGKSEAAKRRWTDPDYRAKISASRKATHARDDFRAVQRAKKLEQYSDDATRRIVAEQMTRKWQDPAYRAHMVRAHTKPSKDKGFI